MWNSLYWITKAAGERAGSALLTASAWHHRSDAISSVVALIGVGMSSQTTYCSTLLYRTHHLQLISIQLQFLDC